MTTLTNILGLQIDLHGVLTFCNLGPVSNEKKTSKNLQFKANLSLIN